MRNAFFIFLSVIASNSIIAQKTSIFCGILIDDLSGDPKKNMTIVVEKIRTNFSEIIRITLLIILVLLAGTAMAQKMQMVKGYCGIYYRTMDDLFKQKQPELDFYEFRPGQTVASIGAQCCHWEASYAAATDSVYFYLQDIDTSFFNQRQAGFAWHYYDSIRGKPMSSTYTLVTGNETSTGLPESFFDKIIIINSFHEFTAKETMLNDITAKLKLNGILYIDESVPRKQGQKHGVCKKPMLMPDEMITLLKGNGYMLIDSLDINFKVNHTYRKIYAFKKIKQ